MSRPMFHNKVTTVLALVVLAGTAAGCGGDGGDVAGTSIVSSSTTATTGRTTATTATTLAETTTTVPTGPVAPLTGAVEPEGTDLNRPALALKIDNHALARPQVGLEDADLVFDVRAEGVTRFLAVYHLTPPDTVGPVRSSRTSDFDLLRGLDHPLYGSSGGNNNVMAGLEDVPAYVLTGQNRNEYFRDESRPAPHNLFVHPADLYALAPEEATTPPEPWFTYHAPDVGTPDPADATADLAGTPLAGELTVDFAEGPTVGFTWDEATAGWRRTQDGQPHVTSDGAQLAPANVVIMVTTYDRSDADPRSPEVISTGSGDLVVLTGGNVIEGTWDRPEPTAKPTLLDSDGNPVPLTPGQTWILYPEASQIQY